MRNCSACRQILRPLPDGTHGCSLQVPDGGWAPLGNDCKFALLLSLACPPVHPAQAHQHECVGPCCLTLPTLKDPRLIQQCTCQELWPPKTLNRSLSLGRAPRVCHQQGHPELSAVSKQPTADVMPFNLSSVSIPQKPHCTCGQMPGTYGPMSLFL